MAKEESGRAENDAANGEVEAYLDALSDELKMLDAVQREEIRDEVRGHLQMLINRHGGDPDAARLAMEQFGEAHATGRAIARHRRLDNLRHWLRRGHLKLRALAFLMLFMGAASCWIFAAFCHIVGWGAVVAATAVLPALAGAVWGARSESWRGYFFVMVAGVLVLPWLPIPMFISHFDTERAGVVDLSLTVRGTYVMLWLMVACAFCGVANILSRASCGDDRKRAAS